MSTPNMGLVLPTVSVTPGPLWATDVNAAFTVIDGHNHTVGNGVQVPTLGLNINADLTMNGYNLTGLRSTRFNNQSSTLSLSTDVGCLYVVNGNLYYNNVIGNQIQITAGAGLNATSVGGFGGDYGTSTASAFYTSATTTFTYWSNTNVSAFTSTGAVTIHPTNSSTLGVTLSVPTSITSSYALSLPTAAPTGNPAFVTMDTSGNLGVSSYSTVGGLTQSTKAIRTVGSTTTTPGAVNISGSCGVYTAPANNVITPVPNLQCVLPCLGNPVMVTLQSDGSGNLAYFTAGVQSGALAGAYLYRNGTQLASITTDGNRNTSFSFLDTGAPAGTNTYQFELCTSGSSIPSVVNYMVLTAYEL